MSVSAITATSTQAQGLLALQQTRVNATASLLQGLFATTATTTSVSSLTAALVDMVSLSSAGQQLAQAPAAVTQAMSDLFTSTTSSSNSNLAVLQAYFQQNPGSLASVLQALQGGAGTYSAAGLLGASSSVTSALIQAQVSAQASGQMLGILTSTADQSPNTLLAALAGLNPSA